MARRDLWKMDYQTVGKFRPFLTAEQKRAAGVRAVWAAVAWSAVLGVSVGGAAGGGAWGRLVEPGPSTAGAVVPVDAVEREIAELAAVVGDEGAVQARRDDAARRLVSRIGGRQGERIRVTLLEALINVQNRGGQLATARALVWLDSWGGGAGGDTGANGAGGIGGGFVAPLNALLGADRQTTEAAAQAMANFQDTPQVTGLLLRFLNGGGGTAKPELSRVAVVRALAAVPEKPVAEALVKLVGNRAESDLIREAASESLSDLAGRAQGATNAAGWEKWWAEASRLTDEEFRRVSQAARSGRLTSWRYRYEQLSDELSMLLLEGHRLIPESQRAERLIRLLRSTQPAIRAAGVRIALGDALEARAVPQAAREAIRQMVGDESPTVRLEVANALRSLNDAAALDPLLTQLRQETDAEVRAAMVSALGPIRDVRSLPALLELLDGAQGRSALAAAEALERMGIEIRKDSAMADVVATRLREVLSERDGGEELRAAAMEALVPLRRRDVLPLAQAELQPTSSTRMRRAALRLLAELRDADTGPLIAATLEDPSSDAGVRLEAVAALGAIPTFEYAETISRRLSVGVEPDAVVRARAWAVLSELFGQANREQLADWSQRFRDDPPRRLVVLTALAAELRSPGDEGPLAVCRQQQGETLLLLGRPADAVVPLREALEIWQGKGARNQYTEVLQTRTLEALLQSRQYGEAAGFAQREIARVGDDEGLIAPKLTAEIARLADAGEIPAANLLLSEVRRMRPELGAAYQPALAKLDERLRGPTTLPTSPTTQTTQPASTSRPAGPP